EGGLKSWEWCVEVVGWTGEEEK
nr:hypothetical protein [Tanacetum cinerariifolium]